jgi:hypothetical protein
VLIRVKKASDAKFRPVDIFESLGNRERDRSSVRRPPDISQSDEGEVPSLKLTGLLLIWCGEFVFEQVLTKRRYVDYARAVSHACRP